MSPTPLSSKAVFSSKSSLKHVICLKIRSRTKSMLVLKSLSSLCSRFKGPKMWPYLRKYLRLKKWLKLTFTSQNQSTINSPIPEHTRRNLTIPLTLLKKKKLRKKLNNARNSQIQKHLESNLSLLPSTNPRLFNRSLMTSSSLIWVSPSLNLRSYQLINSAKCLVQLKTQTQWILRLSNWPFLQQRKIRLLLLLTMKTSRQFKRPRLTSQSLIRKRKQHLRKRRIPNLQDSVDFN